MKYLMKRTIQLKNGNERNNLTIMSFLAWVEIQKESFSQFPASLE